ncbi:MAG: prolyl oligopeptidase family serine peptidase [Gordonia sp. (in: high G+C Gram-positive bacteria)]|uniref:alpha/beta hydrolase family protein n=1 Tax=Gordonia sp. (in: high G+C Gram-positive bacteria) TaxID=84139 RepID=UPI0039E23BAB
MKRRKIAYGEHPSQYGHLYLPDRERASGRAPLVVLVHGGSWSAEFALVVYSAVARDLVARGAVVWNVEYRRLGDGGTGGDGPAHSVPGGGDVSPAHSVPGGGWPQTGRDVVAALRALDGPVAGELAVAGIAVDRQHVSVVGHSAGGQLATWAVAQLGARTDGHRITTVVPQSAVLDLTVDGARDKESVTAFLGASYRQAPRRYTEASPAHAPVTDARLHVVHTTDDRAVPLAMSEHYVAVMTERGQSAMLTEVPGEHACFVNPKTPAHRATLRALGL